MFRTFKGTNPLLVFDECCLKMGYTYTLRALGRLQVFVSQKAEAAAVMKRSFALPWGHGRCKESGGPVDQAVLRSALVWDACRSACFEQS